MKRIGKIGCVTLVLVSTVFVVNFSNSQSGYTVVERGPDYNVLQKTTVVNGASHVSRVTVIATGLNLANSAGNYGDYTFTPGTWFVAGPVYGRNVTIQAGAVLKFPNDAAASIIVCGSLTCPSAGSPAAICTAGDDDSVGVSLNGVWPGYTGTIQPPAGGYGGYGNPAFSIPADPGWPEYGSPVSVVFENVRIRYAGTAVALGYETFASFIGSQIIECGQAALLDDGGVSESSGTVGVSFNNTLICSVDSLVTDNTTYGGFYGLVNCTIDDCPLLLEGYNAFYGNLTACNNVLSSSGDENIGFLGGDYNGFYCSPNVSDWWNGWGFGTHQYCSLTMPFTSACYGDNCDDQNYYLATNSLFLHKGTLDIDPGLLADLRAGTTCAPQDGNFKDCEGYPSLGYHYTVSTSTANDSVPDWWKCYWFGTNNVLGAESDAFGNTVLDDYQHSLVPIMILQQPLSQTVAAGETATFGIVLTSKISVAYQWTLNGTPIPGATSSSYSLTDVSVHRDNGARVRCIVSTPGGTIASQTATLTVNKHNHGKHAGEGHGNDDYDEWRLAGSRRWRSRRSRS